ncbi:TetR family transcriptional regulator [Reticulibacter mediterranei]|uniref:TetR family transcriptional regulator n=1 Tax=Reticulibacter mediterranei TaxID=2778369 RepID=A0A8J3N4L7_9CHLR|nr:TetR/AcrR family transcriptional regulator [Reticulibacter mediterranei]GHO94217.1 TetR family transcriptional regulator [Reticulibacter mediterranei]
MTEQKFVDRNSAGRRRNDKSHKAILQAALDLLEQDGYRALTIEAIAAQAGVGKQTIYRWWPSKAAVVLEAFTANAATQIPQPDTGSLRQDLQEFFAATLHAGGERTALVLRSLMAEALLDPEFAEQFLHIFIYARRNALGELLTRGVQRGQLAADVDINFLLDLVYGAIWYRVLVQHAALDEVLMEQLVDMLRRYNPA